MLSCRDLQKATYNFTTLIGQGAFGPVYKAQITTDETVAVKVLATDSKQGEKEFQTEVLLVNNFTFMLILVYYCYFKLLLACVFNISIHVLHQAWFKKWQLAQTYLEQNWIWFLNSFFNYLGKVWLNLFPLLFDF